MVAFDLIWLLLVGCAGAFPFDYASNVLMGSNYSGYLSIGVNPMTVVLLMLVGLFIGLLGRNSIRLQAIFTSGKMSERRILYAVFLSGLISLVFYVLLGKLSYSLSLDNRYIGVGMLGNAITILVGAMVKKGRKEIESFQVVDGLFIGGASLLAFFPGASFLGALFLLLRFRGYNYRAIGEISSLALMVNVLTAIFSYLILFPGYFDFNGSFGFGLMMMVIAAIAGAVSTFGYEIILQHKLPKLLALVSFLAGIILVFF